MLAKKSRTHSCGFSNIDFRSQKDEPNIKIFQPWKIQKSFGTMGNSDYHLKFKEYKNLMNPTAKLNTLYEKKNEAPDPKIYSTCVLYSSQKLPIKPEALHVSDKVGELDETYKGKERFIGDSMMIAEITKVRKKDKSLSQSDKFSKRI